MGSKGYTISVATDSRLFEQGVRMGIIKPVEEADDALTDLGKNRGPDQLTDELKDAQRATDKLGDEARQNARQMQADYRRTGQVARDAAEEGGSGWSRATRKASRESGESLREFGSEAKQNIGETFSSFRGDASDFAQIAQDTLGGLASGLEGIPAIAAVAAGAAGLGLVLGAIEDGNVKSEAWKQSVSELAQSLIDTGEDGAPAVDRIVDALKKLATSTDDITLDKLSKLADQAGADFRKLGQTWGGNSSDLRVLWRELDKNKEALLANVQAAQKRGDSDLQQKYLGEANAAITLRDAIGSQIGVATEAEAQTRAYAAAGGPELEAKAQLIQNIDSAYDEAAGAVSDYVNSETGIFDTGKYIEAMQQKAAALDEYKTNLQIASMSLTPEAISYIESQGAEAASTLVSAYVNGTAEQQAQLAGIWSTAGKTSADSYSASLKAGIPTSLPGPTVSPQVDTSAAQVKFSDFIRLNSNRQIPMIVVPTPGRGLTG